MKEQKVENICPIKCCNSQKNHFFGYYNKTCFDAKDERILALEADFMDTKITTETSFDVGYFDAKGEFIKLDSTKAWNFQMGTQLNFVSEDEVIYNVRVSNGNGQNDSFKACLLNIKTKEKRLFEKAIYSLAPSKDYFISLNYDRLFVTHETIGYPNHKPFTPETLNPCPSDDGIYKTDIKTGKSTLLISFKGLCVVNHVESMEKAIHWISHAEINPSGERILFLHRWSENVEDEFCFIHRLITIDKNGENIHLLEDGDHPIAKEVMEFGVDNRGVYDYEKSDWQISHPMWKNDKEIIVWGPNKGKTRYQLYQDKIDGKVERIGETILLENGHMSYNHLYQDFLLTDTYPNDDDIRELLIYDVKNRILHVIGRFYTPDLKKVSRCDLHPRWSNDGLKVCIDSVHENARQMYVLDCSKIILGERA